VIVEYSFLFSVVKKMAKIDQEMREYTFFAKALIANTQTLNFISKTKSDEIFAV